MEASGQVGGCVGAWVGGGAGEVGSRSWRVSLSTPRAMLGSDEVPFQGNVSDSLRLPCKEWLEVVAWGVVTPVVWPGQCFKQVFCVVPA